MMLQAKVFGKGSPSIILLPGGLTGWIDWDPFVAYFERERQVIQVQLLNVQLGLEGKPLPPDYSIKTESRALSATLDSLGVGSIDIIAWSFGGVVAIDYALDHKEKVRSLVLIEPPALWVLKDKNPEILAEQFRLLAWTKDENISEERLEQFLWAVGLCPRDISPRKFPQWPIWVEHRRSLRNVPANLRHWDDLERLKNFTRPVLLIKGKNSDSVLHKITDILVESFPCSEVAEFPGGHAPHLLNVEGFLEKVTRFHKTATMKG